MKNKTTESIVVGPTLASYRKAVNLSVQQVADKTGYSRSGIIKMERPEANPTVKSLQLYLRACGRTLGELFHNGNGRKRETAH